MYIGSWKIDDLVTFTVNTHSPTTGGESDADSLPTYRVYENETGMPILTGSMAKLDDANTLGFYSEQITLSAANGFEKGKSYNIRINAVVGGVSASTLRQLQVEAEVDANVVSDKTNYELSGSGITAIQSGLATQALLTTLVTYVDTEVGAIKSVTDKLDTALQLDGSVYRFTLNSLELAPTGGGTAPTVQEIVDGVLDEVLASHNDAGSVGEALSAAGAAGDPLLGTVETGLTLKNAIRLLVAFACGKTSGGGTDEITFRDYNDSLDRLVFSLDSNNNRLIVTRNLT